MAAQHSKLTLLMQYMTQAPMTKGMEALKNCSSILHDNPFIMAKLLKQAGSAAPFLLGPLGLEAMPDISSADITDEDIKFEAKSAMYDGLSMIGGSQVINATVGAICELVGMAEHELPKQFWTT